MPATWEWRNDDFAFVPFHQADSEALEMHWQKNNSEMKIAIHKERYVIDFLNLLQRNERTGKERLIRRVGPGGEVASKTPVWEWEDTPGHWQPYDTTTSDNIDRGFLKNDLTHNIKVATSAHDTVDMQIHFGHMHQLNTATHGVRKVRRTLRVSTTVGDGDSRKRSRGGDFTPPVALSISEKSWEKVGTLLVLRGYELPSKAEIKIAGFDMDDTLIYPRSGAVFAKSRADWQWLTAAVPSTLKALASEGYYIVIFSNQSGITRKGKWDDSLAKQLQGKFVDVAKSLSIPVLALISTTGDDFHKPCCGQWDFLESLSAKSSCTVDKACSFYCGDAAGRELTTLAGRKKDFSCSDRKFAYNIGVAFKTPEEFFLKRSPVRFSWGDITPEFLSGLPTSYSRTNYDREDRKQELVVMVGPPASGKSTFSERFLVSKGYVRINRDTLKTPEKCVGAAEHALDAGKCVIADNTSPSVEERKRYIQLAVSRGIPCRCFLMEIPEALAMHMNIVRARLGLCDRISSVAYRFFKSRYVAPSTEENLEEIVIIPPVVDFSGLPPNAKRFFVQLS